MSTSLCRRWTDCQYKENLPQVGTLPAWGFSRHCVVELFCQRVGAELSTVRLAVFDCVFEGWFGLSYSSMSLFRQLLYTFACLLSAEIADTRAVPNIPPFRWIRRNMAGIFSGVPPQSI